MSGSRLVRTTLCALSRKGHRRTQALSSCAARLWAKLTRALFFDLVGARRGANGRWPRHVRRRVGRQIYAMAEAGALKEFALIQKVHQGAGRRSVRRKILRAGTRTSHPRYAARAERSEHHSRYASNGTDPVIEKIAGRFAPIRPAAGAGAGHRTPAAHGASLTRARACASARSLRADLSPWHRQIKLQRR